LRIQRDPVTRPRRLQKASSTSPWRYATGSFQAPLSADTRMPRTSALDAYQTREGESVDQLEWLTGGRDDSARAGLLFWVGPEMYGAKWHDFKLVLVVQKYLTDPALRLATPHLINLITDPQEREPLPLPYLHTCELELATQSAPRAPAGRSRSRR
jgi:hypothetical protein